MLSDTVNFPKQRLPSRGTRSVSRMPGADFAGFVLEALQAGQLALVDDRVVVGDADFRVAARAKVETANVRTLLSQV